MEVINGRDISCKNSITGVKRVFLTPYVKIQRSQYTYNGVRLSKFTLTYLHQFDFKTQANFNQSLEIKDGNTFFIQTLSLTFNKQTEFDNLNFQKIIKREFRIVVEMKSGDFFLMGFKNGVSADKLELSENQQYSISFKGMEEDLVPYINTLIGTDFIIYKDFNLLFQDGTNQTFQNNTNITT